MNNEEDEEELKRIITWLHALPEGVVLGWGSDHLSLEHPFSSGWVDVRVPTMCSELDLRWVWTILTTDEADDCKEDPTNIAVPYDLAVHAVSDPSENYPYVLEYALPAGRSIDPKRDARLNTLLQKKPERAREVFGAWSAHVISKSLERWTTTFVKRSDIRFRWDPFIGMSNEARTAMKTMNEFQDRLDAHEMGT